MFKIGTSKVHINFALVMKYLVRTFIVTTLQGEVKFYLGYGPLKLCSLSLADDSPLFTARMSPLLSTL